MRNFAEHCASSQIFSDFGKDQDISDVRSPFFHENCRVTRNEEECRFTPKPVSSLCFEEMRNKLSCHEHKGTIATCSNCRKVHSMPAILDFCIKEVTKSEQYRYDRSKRRLDAQVYEQQTDQFWYRQNPENRAMF